MHYTAMVDHQSIDTSRQVEASSLREVMRRASNVFKGLDQKDADIKIFRQQDGHEPELCATRKVTARYWNYAKPERPHARRARPATRTVAPIKTSIVRDERPAALASSRTRSKTMSMSNRGFDFLENNLFS